MKEKRDLEFKEDIKDSFLKTVSAYANYGPGKILFGVTDEGKVKGIVDPESASLKIENKINDSIHPRPDYSLKVDAKTQVITLTVQQGIFKPYMYKGQAYKRNDTSTVTLDHLELKRMILTAENKTFDDLPVTATDLSFTCLFQSLRDKLGLSDPDLDTLRTLGLIRLDRSFNNAAVLLSDQNHFPGIDMVKFGNTSSEILQRVPISNTSILDQLQQAEKVFAQNYRIEEIEGMERKEKYLIPLKAFREALANALVHRTWDVDSPIRVFMYEDRIEISSPGGLPEGISEHEYLAGRLSIIRNPILANLFFRLNIIEKLGTGIIRIKESYQGLQFQPRFNVDENSICVLLPSLRMKEILSSDEKALSGCLATGLILSSSELVERTGFGKDKVIKLLHQLIKKGYIVKLGAGRGTKYRAL